MENSQDLNETPSYSSSQSSRLYLTCLNMGQSRRLVSLVAYADKGILDKNKNVILDSALYAEATQGTVFGAIKYRQHVKVRLVQTSND